jgi:hypothetical protein
MEKMTELKKTLAMSQIDPNKTTLFEAVAKFQEYDLRHLILYTENGGFLCLCGDPELGRRFREAVKRIDEEMDREEDAKTAETAA